MKSEIFASFFLGMFCNATFSPVLEYDCIAESPLLTHFSYQAALSDVIGRGIGQVVRDWKVRSEFKGVTYCWEAQNKMGDALSISQNPCDPIPYFHVNYFPKTELRLPLLAVGSQKVNEIVTDDELHVWIYMPEKDKTVLLNQYGVCVVEGYEVGKSINQFLSA